MSKRVKGITIEINGETKGLDKALKGVNSTAYKLNSELRDVEKLLKFSPGNAELVAQKQRLLAEQVTNTTEKLDQLKQAEAQVQAQFERGDISEAKYREFQREIIETESRLRHFEDQLDSTQSGFDRMAESAAKAGEKIKSAGEKTTAIGKKMTKTVTAPIVGAGAAALKMAIDFESAFAGVKKTVDATEEEYEELRKGILEMTQSLPASAEEIAAVAESAGQLGIAKENILAFTRTMIDLGESTNMTSEVAATQLARFANIVNMSQGDFDRLGSSVVSLGNNFATTEGEIVAMAMRLAAQGNIVGMSEAQITALSATMSSLGVNAEAGGTAMTTILKKINAAVGEGGASLKGFADTAGVSSAEFAKLWKDEPVAALDAFVKGLAESGAAGENMASILANLGIKGIHESDVLQRMTGNTKLLSDAVNLSTKAWEENTALSNEAAQRYETTASQMKILWNNIKILAIEIGDVLIPMLVDLIEWLTPIIQSFSGMSDSTKRLIVVIGGIAAAIGPLLIVLGMMAQGLGAILTMAPAIGAALTVMTGPIGLVIAAIAALVAIGVILYKNWDSISEWFVELWDSITETFTSAIEGIAEFFSGVWDNMSSVVFAVWDVIKQYLGNVWTIIKNIFVGGFAIILALFTGQWEEAWNITKQVFMNIVTAAAENLLLLKDLFTSGLTAIADFFKFIWGGIKTFFTETIKEIVVNGLTQFGHFVLNIIKTVSELPAKIRELLGEVLSFLANIDLKQIGIDMIMGLIKGIVSMAKAVVDSVKGVVDGAIKGAKDILDIHSPSRVFREIGIFTGEGLEQGLLSMGGRVERASEKMASFTIPENTPQIDTPEPSGSQRDSGGDSQHQGPLIYIENMNVRDEEDIQRLSRELYALIERAKRGRG